MVNIFGLNGSASPDASEIGWSGIDVPEQAKPYLYPRSALRDSLREKAVSKEGSSAEDIKNIVSSQAEPETASGLAKPYAKVLSDFKDTVSSLDKPDTIRKDILGLCDHLRDIDLFDLGIYLKYRENLPALVRPVTKELLQLRKEKAAKLRQKQLEKVKREKKKHAKDRKESFESFGDD